MEKKKDRILNVNQVGKYLNCSRRHVYNLISLGELSGFKIGSGGGVRVRESKLEEFLEKREQEEGLF